MYEKVLKHFGGASKLAEALSVSLPAVSQWRVSGFPAARAIEIERITHGKFKAKDIIERISDAKN